MVSNIHQIVRDNIESVLKTEEERGKLARRFFKRDSEARVRLVITIKNEPQFTKLSYFDECKLASVFE